MTSEDRELLERYCPELHYEPREPYRADAADIVAVHAADDVPTHTPNRLLRAPNTLLASTIDEGVGDLTMPYLGANYPDGTKALATDRLDLGGPDFVKDAHARRVAGPFADRLHGRVVRRRGRTFLQYWFFYYFNSKTLLGVGKHEGDWEYVQAEVVGERTLDLVYSQHRTAERRRIDLDDEGWARPRVYVAAFSHACYFAPGKYPIDAKWLGPFLPGGLVDEAAASPNPVLPRVIDFGTRRWASWPGLWGNTDPRLPFGDSPTGPCRKKAWTDPIGYAAQARRPKAGLAAAADAAAEGLLPPPAPPVEVDVDQAADGFKVSFAIDPAGLNPAAAVAVTLVAPDSPPATYAIEVVGPTGDAFITYPTAGVTAVDVTTVAVDGQMSDPVRVELPAPGPVGVGVGMAEAAEELPPLRTLAPS